MEVTVVNKTLEDHENRIAQLEKNESEIKNSLLRLENTVISSSNTTNNLLNRVIDHHFADKMQQSQTKTEMYKSKITFYSSLVGSGGILFLLVQWLLG